MDPSSDGGGSGSGSGGFRYTLPNIQTVAQADHGWCLLACAVCARFSLYPQLLGADTKKLQESMAKGIFWPGNLSRPVESPIEYVRWSSYLFGLWGVWARPDVLDAVNQLPPTWDALVRRIAAGHPVIMAVNYPGDERRFGRHAMVVYGVSEHQGVRRVSIMDPGDGGFRYEDSLTYEQACDSFGTKLPASGRRGWRWVSTHTCGRRFGQGAIQFMDRLALGE